MPNPAVVKLLSHEQVSYKLASWVGGLHAVL